MVGKRQSAIRQILIGLAIAIGGAVIGYAFAYMQQHRQAQVNFVGSQIDKLYSPLLALSKVHDYAWKAFTQKDGQYRSAYFAGTTPSDADVELWRRWMQGVFQPLNVKMETTLLENSQYLVNGEMPELFSTLLLHTEIYKAIIARWGTEGIASVSKAKNWTPIDYPEGLTDCLNDQIDLLREVNERLQSPIVGLTGTLEVTVATKCLALKK